MELKISSTVRMLLEKVSGREEGGVGRAKIREGEGVG